MIKFRSAKQNHFDYWELELGLEFGNWILNAEGRRELAKR